MLPKKLAFSWISTKASYHMNFIKTLLGLVILLVIIVFGYWLYASYYTAPAAPYWAEINTYMPDPLRRFSCDKTREREGATAPIQSCEGL